MERANLTLRQWLEQERPSPARILDVVLATGRGLAAVHRQGVVHRDFKPDNVLMDAEGQPRVSDFGLALSTEAAATGSIAGTPAYMAPEQLRGDEVDARSDQFSYAVAALEAFTGQRPFQGESREELLEAMLARVPRSALGSGLPPGVAPILLRALEPEPAARFPSMDALIEHLELTRSRSPGRPLLWLLAGGAVVAIGVALLFGRGAKREPVVTPSSEPTPVSSSAPAPIQNVTRICVSAIRSSSEQPEHPARHAFDGIPSTAWAESAPGDGAGEWLEAELRPKTWVSSVEVSGGWSTTTSAGADLWAINSTFRVMRISWDGGEAEVRFDRKADRGKRKQVRIEAETRRIRITAAEVDRGRFRDLCLDEVAIFGRCPQR
jgi:serine/threonine protein kinase